MMGQIPSRQPKKPLNKGFFMYSYMPPTGNERLLKLIYKIENSIISRDLSIFIFTRYYSNFFFLEQI